MTNRERLEEAKIIKAPPPSYTPEEIDTLESLDENEMDLILNQGQDIRDVVNAHTPTLPGIGFGRLTNP